ncbi:hypothetical protein, partial [Mycobacterium canetti]
MNHLTTLDAGFLKAEDVDRHVMNRPGMSGDSSSW